MISRGLINLSFALSGLAQLGDSLLRGSVNNNIQIININLNEIQNSKIVEDQTCCIICTNGLQKYYSVSNWFESCGETCIDPDHYDIYKIFEPALSRAPINNICEELGYSLYTKTERQGTWPVKIIFDNYKKQDIYEDNNDNDGSGSRRYEEGSDNGPCNELNTFPVITKKSLRSRECPTLTETCEYLPGYYQCCPYGESCIPNVGCRC